MQMPSLFEDCGFLPTFGFSNGNYQLSTASELMQQMMDGHGRNADSSLLLT